MKKIVRLTESDIHQIILNTARTILRERHVLEIPHSEDDMMPSDPMMGSNEPPMGEGPDMDNGMPPMEDEGIGNAPMEGSEDMPDFWGKLSSKQQDSVRKYAESMIDDDNDPAMEGDDMGADPSMGSNEPPMGDMPQGGGDPNAMGGAAPMQEDYVREFNNIALQDRPQKREDKNIPEKRKNKFSPFKVNR